MVDRILGPNERDWPMNFLAYEFLLLSSYHVERGRGQGRDGQGKGRNKAKTNKETNKRKTWTKLCAHRTKHLQINTFMR